MRVFSSSLLVLLFLGSAKADSPNEGGTPVFPTGGSLGLPGNGSLAGLSLVGTTLQSNARYAFQGDSSQLIVLAEPVALDVWSTDVTGMASPSLLAYNTAGFRFSYGTRAWGGNRRREALPMLCLRKDYDRSYCTPDAVKNIPDRDIFVPGETITFGMRVYINELGNYTGGAGEFIFETDRFGPHIFASVAAGDILSYSDSSGSSSIMRLDTVEARATVGMLFPYSAFEVQSNAPATINLGVIAQYMHQWYDVGGENLVNDKDNKDIEAAFVIVGRYKNGSILLSLGGRRPLAYDYEKSQPGFSNSSLVIFQIMPAVAF